MNIAICDDENFWVDELRKLLLEYCAERHSDCYTTVFSSGNKLLSSGEMFDVIFMDYQMNGLNGIETAKEIRERNDECAIIFFSSYPDIAVDAFEVNAYRFLVKPVDKHKLFKSLDDFRKRTETDEFVILKSRNEERILRASEIILCEAVSKHSLLHMPGETIEIPKNIKEIEKLMTNDLFFRCHKAFIVSFRHIRSFDNNMIVMDNGKQALISRNLLAGFKTAFQEYILKYNMGRM